MKIFKPGKEVKGVWHVVACTGCSRVIGIENEDEIEFFRRETVSEYRVWVEGSYDDPSGYKTMRREKIIGGIRCPKCKTSIAIEGAGEVIKNRYTSCPDCLSGKIEYKEKAWTRCGECWGSGKIRERKEDSFSIYPVLIEKTCPRCGGEKEVWRNVSKYKKCSRCGGKGALFKYSDGRYTQLPWGY